MAEVGFKERKKNKLGVLVPSKVKIIEQEKVTSVLNSIEFFNGFSKNLNRISGETTYNNPIKTAAVQKDIPSVYSLSKNMKRALERIAKV